MSWKGGSTSWLPMKDLKETDPLEVVDSALANQIEQGQHLLESSLV